jgi:hypothetical protein
MVTTFVRIAFALALLGAGRQLYLWACPWYATEIVTTFARHPDIPRTQYVGGKLGVLLPSFATSYQVIAYRYLEGLGMNAGEQSQANLYLLDLERRDPWDRTAPDWGEEWTKLRAIYSAGKAGGVKKERLNRNDYSYELNCADDAFRVASFTLRDRLKRVGSASPFFKNWFAAQEAVFSNCDGSDGDALPALPNNAPEWLRQDRVYQIGAWFFYHGESEKAIEAFRLVAADPKSPWRVLGRYLIARTMTREVQANPKMSDRAMREIDGILKDAKLAPIHGAVRALRRRNLIIAKPEETMLELSAALSSRGMDLSLRQDLWDFVSLFDKADRSPVTRKLSRNQALPDWLSVMQRPDAEGAVYAYKRWQQKRDNTWLVAALSTAIASDPEVEQLLEAAAGVGEQSPAYFTLAYHRARILCELRRYDEAKIIVDPLVESRSLGLSTRNLFAVLRAQSAIDLSSFLKGLPRQPVLIHDDADLGEVAVRDTPHRLRGQKFLGFNEVRLLNHSLPLKALSELALGEELPNGLSVELRRVALMRALALERSELYRPLALALQKSVAAYAAPLQLALRSEDSKLRDALLHFTIQQPEIRLHFFKSGSNWESIGKLNDSRDDFWPALQDMDSLDREQQGGWAKCEDEGFATGRLNYRVTEGLSETAQKEWALLEEAGAANKFYMKYALDYYEAHPRDAGNEALLGGAVRVWNNTWRDVNDLPTAIRVWRILQLKYPKSKWAERYRSGVTNAYGPYPEQPKQIAARRNLFPGVGCRYEPWN